MAAKTQGTWVITSEIGIPPLTQVDTAAAYTLGKRVRAKDAGSTAYGEAEFIYVKGGTSIAVGSVCTIDGTFGLTLITAKAKGAVGLAISVLDSTSKWGWVQVRGCGVAKCDSGITAGAQLFIDTTNGQVDDTAVTGDVIAGMLAYSTDDTGTCVASLITNPAVGDYDNA